MSGTTVDATWEANATVTLAVSEEIWDADEYVWTFMVGIYQALLRRHCSVIRILANQRVMICLRIKIETSNFQFSYGDIHLSHVDSLTT